MSIVDQSKIRNFCIIAHIDHGKSTLADRIIEKTGLLTSREMQEQILDNMDLERERGITIKSQAVRTVYKAKDGCEYIFNLIDTPGHVDFNYEVSRSLAACDGAILVVDASQGIEAQTLANVYLALDHDLDVFPVINKVDLPSAQPDHVAAEIEDVIGLDASDAPRVSAKTGENVEAVLEAIVEKIPAPTGDPEAPLQALIFDSIYDSYKGVIIFCRVMEGTVKRGTPIRLMATGAEEDVVEVGYFGAGQFIPCDELSAGMVGYITASIKNVRDTQVGDTVTNRDNPCAAPLPGYKKVTSMVYCGLYPGGRRQIQRSAGRAGEAAAQRRLPVLRAGDLRGSGLRLPLRLFGTAASGDHPGAAGAGVQPGSGDHGAQRGVPGAQEQRGDDRADQPHQPAGSHGDRLHGGAHRQRGDHGDHGVCGLHHDPVPGAPGRLPGHGVH